MSTGMTVALLLGCIALIGAVYAVYKRGTKVENPSAAPTTTGNAKQ